MSEQVYNQISCLLLFILIGILIGLIFDFFRILRRSFKTNTIITAIEDILFWLISGFILLFAVFILNNGEIRLYMFFSLIFGLYIYLVTLSKILIKYLVNIICFFKKILSVPIKFIVNIILKIKRPISVIRTKIRHFFTKIATESKKNRKNHPKKKEINKKCRKNNYNVI